MKPITGPADVKIGNRVRFSDPSGDADSCEGIVTKVSDERLTIRTEDGKSKTAAYIKTRRVRIGRWYETRRDSQWRLVTAEEIWRRGQPKTPLLDGNRHAAFKAAAHDLAARTALHAEVDELADWYAVEPEGEP